MTRALLIGREPDRTFPYEYVKEAPFDAVMIGSLPLSQALRLSDDRVLQALAEGKTVTRDVKVKLVSRDGSWWVVPDQALLAVLSGGLD